VFLSGGLRENTDRRKAELSSIDCPLITSVVTFDVAETSLKSSSARLLSDLFRVSLRRSAEGINALDTIAVG